jgi:hypothetical protein
MATCLPYTLFFFWWGWVWTQDFVLTKQVVYYLSTPPVHSALVILEMGGWVSWTICLVWPWTTILPISGSQVNRITSMSHQCSALTHFYICVCLCSTEGHRDRLPAPLLGSHILIGLSVLGHPLLCWLVSSFWRVYSLHTAASEVMGWGTRLTVLSSKAIDLPWHRYPPRNGSCFTLVIALCILEYLNISRG